MPESSETKRVENIGRRGRRRRAVFGGLWLVVGVVASWQLDRWHARIAWHALLLVPFTLAGLGFFQALEKT